MQCDKRFTHSLCGCVFSAARGDRPSTNRLYGATPARAERPNPNSKLDRSSPWHPGCCYSVHPSNFFRRTCMRKSISLTAVLLSRRYLLPVLPFVAVVGCSTVRPPRDQVAAADLQVKEALNSKASADAPLDLRMAVEKLDKAKVAMSNEHYTQARR